jgi:lambda family phage portal protein
MKLNWIDRAVGYFAPRRELRRLQARAALELARRHYEGAGTGRRTQGWRRSSGDANAVLGPALSRLRENARDLVRNNPYAESALSTIANHTVGYGIQARPNPANASALGAWKAWAESTACDADGRHDFYGLQKLIMRTVAESGEVLVRRRLRRPEDGLPLPLQLQVLDPDFLDTSKDSALTNTGGRRIIQGVEYDGIGRRVAYWLFPEHPGSVLSTARQSEPVPAESILHIFRSIRPGQVRGGSWFAPVLLRFKDFDEFEDATLMKQKIAACLAVITSDTEGSSTGLGTVDDTADPPIDSLEPGAILNVTPGRSVDIVQPPTVREYPDYTKNVLRAIGTGLGIPYEDLTGDYAEMNFSSARASHIKHWQGSVDEWRWQMLIPQFCNPAWAWAMEVAVVMRQVTGAVPRAEWSPPPIPMVDPVNEGLAYQRNIRTGIQSLSEVIRERGYDPKTLLEEMAADNELLDKLKLILDSDPRRMTQAGQAQAPLGEPTRGADTEASGRAVLHAVGGRR